MKLIIQMKAGHNIKTTELLSRSNMAMSTHNMIVTYPSKQAGEEQQWSTFLLCSESVFPGRVIKLQSLGQSEEQHETLNEGETLFDSLLPSRSCYRINIWLRND